MYKGLKTYLRKVICNISRNFPDDKAVLKKLDFMDLNQDLIFATSM